LIVVVFTCSLVTESTGTAGVPLGFTQEVVGPTGDARLGNSVAMDGTTALIGAPGCPYSGCSAGAAYVYVLSGKTWTQQAQLRPSDSSPSDQFGFRVALASDTALVSGTPDGGVYVFVRSGTAWSQQQKIITPAGSISGVGAALAVSGNLALIGVPYYGTAGAAYVYVRIGTSWVLQQSLLAPDAVDGDSFGWSGALNGNTAVVGAFDKNNAPGSSGAAYVFTNSSAVWSFAQEISLPAVQNLGDWVALRGTTLLVGSYSGTYVFGNNGSSWLQTQQLPTAPNAYGGVALSGTLALVSSGASAVDFYASSLGTWSLQQTITQGGPNWGCPNSPTVAIAGNYAVMGCKAQGGSGSVDFFGPVVAAPASGNKLPVLAALLLLAGAWRLRGGRGFASRTLGRRRPESRES
jgi:hypothetical protein